jgi:class 3 adenylate cyclase/esterase/lipase
VEQPSTRYARSGDVTIAYQMWGSGPPIVWVPGFISHVELNWESPFFERAFRRGGEYAQMVTFDKRGTGLSDHDVSFGSFEDRVDDICAVMNAVGLDRATIGGMSEGGPLAILFAAMYPERVDKLVLYGSFARFAPASDYPDGSDASEALVPLIEAAWGTGDVLKLFAQDPPDAETEQRIMARIERYTATPKQAAHIISQISKIDVRPALASIQAPTLVMHSEGDPIVPVALGRYLAKHIPTCERYVEFEGAFHASWKAETTDLFIDETEPFVTGRITSRRVSTERVLGTVLFTDIVDSTARASALGDTAWRQLLERHDEVCRTEVEAHRGRVVKTTGDGVLALFDGPARAVACAQRIVDRVQALGISVRAGIHAGECELIGDDVAGIAVHIASRVMSEAADDQVLVTRTVKDLALGSDLAFTPAGDRQLKGVDEPIAVYTVA